MLNHWPFAACHMLCNQFFFSMVPCHQARRSGKEPSLLKPKWAAVSDIMTRTLGTFLHCPLACIGLAEARERTAAKV